jgi:hypothetical protein
MKERYYQILLGVLALSGGIVGSLVTSYLDHSLPPLKGVPLQPFFMQSENVSYITNPRSYPVIVDEQGISVRDFAGITAFFYFTATGAGVVGNDSNGGVFVANNLTAYARIFLDLQPYRNVTSFLFNNQGRYTLPAQYNTDYYSVSISLPLVRVTTVEIEAFLACWRCSVVLDNVVVNGTLFY